jgi:hypothetical protein
MKNLSKERVKEEIKEYKERRNFAIGFGILSLFFSSILIPIGFLAGIFGTILGGFICFVAAVILYAMSFYYHARYQDFKEML